tara:strand:- start:7702 stop:9120 length:1419 start_codon:yes stop_codon:yes gene_type:complete
MKNTKQSIIDKLISTKEDLDGISPSFCTAKWLQHTLYLQNGMNHSCHHPPTHKIPLSEIAADPSALHNTKHKKAEQAQMLRGERPSGCDYCWRVEDMDNEHFSDRVYKSSANWAKPYVFDVLGAGDGNINPTYLEISFSNVCNLKCAYCSPDLSSKWYEEIKQHGAYPTSTNYNGFDVIESMGKMPIPNKDDNPYVDAFWKWWPDLYPDLHTLRLTGGEPLMSKDCWNVLENICKDPREDLVLSINTNLDVPDAMIDRLIELLLDCGPHLREVQIFSSGEATGSAAEYTRFGLKYDNWINNCHKVITALSGKMKIVFPFMTTVSILSAGTFDKFIEQVVEFRRLYINDHMKQGNMIPMMTNYLRYPNMLALCNLTTTEKVAVKERLDIVIEKYSIANHNFDIDNGFIWEDEIDQIKRLIEFMNQGDVGDKEQHRIDFVNFVDEYDKRRGTDFNATFPELNEYYRMIKNEKAE